MKTLELLAETKIAIRAHRTAHKLYQARLAPTFSPFAFIASDELTLSSLLAWLLDATEEATHGQREAFLSAFTKLLDLQDWTPQMLAGASRPRLEVATHRIAARQRRLDILIESQGYAIAIENKPWAGEQQEQLGAYVRHLKEAYKDRFHLIYLVGRQAIEPSSIDADTLAREIEAKRFSVVRYLDLVPWLTECRTSCQSDRVSTFLDEFQRFIEAQFGEAKPMSASRDLEQRIAGSVDDLEAAFEIAATLPIIRRSLLELFESALVSELKTRPGWRLSTGLTKAGTLLVHFPEGISPFGMGFLSGDSRSLIYGLHRVATITNDDEVRTILRDAGLGDSEKPTVTWQWYQRAADRSDRAWQITGDWQSTSQPWAAILRDPTSFAKEFLELADKFRNALLADQAGVTLTSDDAP